MVILAIYPIILNSYHFKQFQPKINPLMAYPSLFEFQLAQPFT